MPKELNLAAVLPECHTGVRVVRVEDSSRERFVAFVLAESASAFARVV